MAQRPVLRPHMTNIQPSPTPQNSNGKRFGNDLFYSNHASKKLRIDNQPTTTCVQPPLSPPSTSYNNTQNSFIQINNNSDSESSGDNDSIYNANAAAAKQAALLIRNRRGSKSCNPPIPKRRKSFAVPESDRIARQNCFEYLVSSIDEVWAQYCVCTSSAENDKYDESNPKNLDGLPSSPVSLCGEEDGEEAGYSSTDDVSSNTNMSCPGTPKYSVYLNNYRGQQQKTSRSGSSIAADVNAPESVRLLNLKKRLMNAKYFLSDLVDAVDPVSSQEFWSKFDVIKYELISVLEENGDDDDIVESTCEDLEKGRHYSRY